jgi:hypothetical protein
MCSCDPTREASAEPHGAGQKAIYHGSAVAPRPEDRNHVELALGMLPDLRARGSPRGPRGTIWMRSASDHSAKRIRASNLVSGSPANTLLKFRKAILLSVFGSPGAVTTTSTHQ